MNPLYSQTVKEDLNKMVENEFIYLVINIEWIYLVVIILKKPRANDKIKLRVCQDYRKLNDYTKKDYFPLPFIDIILDRVAGHNIYSFLDGFSRYYQVFI